jgi:hypothetical protein
VRTIADTYGTMYQPARLANRKEAGRKAQSMSTRKANKLALQNGAHKSITRAIRRANAAARRKGR